MGEGRLQISRELYIYLEQERESQKSVKPKITETEAAIRPTHIYVIV